MKYRRILLKLSGESLQGTQKYGLSPEVLQSYAAQIRDAVQTGVQIGIVIGGGNIFRGLSGARKGFDRVKGDQMGMLATVINSLALQSALEDNDVKCKVLTSIRMEPIGEYFSRPAPSSTSKPATWSSSAAGPRIPISPPTRPRRCAASRSRPTCC